LEEALKIGFLAFDATRVSANDVDYPLDVVVYPKDSFHMTEYRLEKKTWMRYRTSGVRC
jgi:putative proteasome-type protease